MKNLAEVEQNKNFVVQKIESKDIRLCRRLLELGFVFGASVCVKKKSILKKVLLVQIQNLTLAIRSDIAKCVIVF